MLLKSPEERSELWATLRKATDEEQRELLLLAVAKGVLEELRSEFDLYSSYEDPFLETIVLLDRCNALLDPEMLRLYQGIGLEEKTGGREFFHAIISRLGRIAENQRVDPALRTQAADFYLTWREHVGSYEEEWLTVADVAKKYGVVVQTVYKWINDNKLRAWKTPGGGIRIPARHVTAHPSDSEVVRLAAGRPHDEAVGMVRRVDSGVEPAYEKVVAAIESGNVPPLPRRRYLPDRAGVLAGSSDVAPTLEHVDRFREEKQPRRRRSSYRAKEDR